ncbi:MAG: ABC transporter substrate-binding protein, partial [Angelakisella sp.]
AAEINNLDIQQQSDQINNICIKLTHQTLFELDTEGNRVPGIATDAKWLDDNTLQITLHDNVKFADGTPMTADDVKFTFDMALKCPVAGNLTGLISTEVVDPKTVNMKMKAYSNDFVMSLTYPPFSIQSKKAYESGMEKPYLLGTGQYVFDEWIPGEKVSFVLNKNYWGTNPGVSDKITFKPYLEASSRVIALQNGEIDVCIDPPVNELKYLEEDKNITVFEKPGSRLFYFGFNTTKKPWDNEKLRQAVACAIDRAAVLQAAVYGKGTPQTTILNRGLWGFYDEMPGFDYDVARAKTLMTESGVAAGFKTTLTIANSSPYINIAQVIQANLKEIGIDVEIKTLEDATLKSVCKEGSQDLFLWRWNEDLRPDAVYRDLFNTGSGSNFHHYSDPKVDELTDKVLTGKDEAQRQKDSTELQTYLVNACPQVPLYIANLVIAYNKNLQGEFLRGGGDHYWRNAYIAK